MPNRGYAYASIVTPDDRGSTLLAHLTRRYRHSSAETWERRLSDGEVTLDGVTATGGEAIAGGERLVWRRPPWSEAEVPRHFAVLWEDAHLLAVNKPRGLPTLPGGGFLENTLFELVRQRSPEANPVHRLGRGTSGIVLFAKTAAAAAKLAAGWNTARTRKIYRALAQGVAEEDTYRIEAPIGRVAHPRLGQVWAAHAEGKPARSEARVMARREGRTIFEVSLGSGRPHQIRIHLAWIGHPLAGDPLYGPGGQPLENRPGLPGDGGYLLHAQTLEFEHPANGAAMRLEAPAPDGFSEAG